jgi:hypothetical protein
MYICKGAGLNFHGGACRLYTDSCIIRLHNEDEADVKERVMNRTKLLEKELMRKAWHPARLRWCLDMEECRDLFGDHAEEADDHENYEEMLVTKHLELQEKHVSDFTHKRKAQRMELVVGRSLFLRRKSGLGTK